MMFPRRRWLLVLLPVLLAGCRTLENQRAAADAEVYDIIGAKELAVLGQPRPFSIDTAYSPRDPATIGPDEIIKERDGRDMLVVNLNEALRLATTQNRNYQTQKENLYLCALTLSDTRHGFTPLANETTTAERIRDVNGEDSGSVASQVTVGQLLTTGGNLGLTLVNNLLQFYTGDPRRSATSAISINLVQPLLRGAGSEVAAENLKQAERDVIYAVRDFSRYQQTFAVDIASSYYRLAQRRDTVYNEYNNYLNLVGARQRAEALAKDRLPEFQVDQTRQDELQARNNYLLAVQQYQADLDGFKSTLGLPLDCRLSMDPSSLEELTRQDPAPLTVDAEASYALALQKRLDMLNAIDRFDDAKRQVKVAANQLQADVEIFGDASIGSTPDRQWERFNFQTWQGDAGIRIKLPLDRLHERNALRSQLITFERQLRALALMVDQVKTDVRTNLRSVEQARQSYQIQKVAVALAERRVESANILLQAGRAETRDLLDAQSALVLARNALTQGLVDYHLARLQFLRDVGMLDLRNGRIVPLLDTTKADGTAPPATDELRPPEDVLGAQPKAEEKTP